MPKYKVLAKCYINDKICNEGEIIEYSGSVKNAEGKGGKHLLPLDAPAPKGKKGKEEKTEEVDPSLEASKSEV